MRKNQLISLLCYIQMFQLLSKQLDCQWEFTFVFIFTRFPVLLYFSALFNRWPFAICRRKQKKPKKRSPRPVQSNFWTVCELVSLRYNSLLSAPQKRSHSQSRRSRCSFGGREIGAVLVTFAPIRPTVQRAAIGFCLRLNWSRCWGGGRVEMLIYLVHNEKIHENSPLPING